MALSQPRTVFGIHSISPYNRTSGEFYGTARVLSGSTFSISGEVIELLGGSSKYSWANEDGTISAELGFTLKEYPNWAMELFLGKKPTENAAESAGNCSTLTNKLGTSLVATTGIATSTVKAANAADLKFGKYVVKAVGAITVDVYASSNIDFNRGTDKSFENDLLKITATPLTIVAATAVEVPGYGIELTGGAGIIALTIGDTATFEVRPINSGSIDAVFGGSSDTYPEFGCIVYAQKSGSDKIFEIDVYRAKAIGLPIGLTANEFSEAEITAKVSYDAVRNGVFAIREVTGA